ncbi:hypothetical protein C2E23DRAFT_857638 [Lenzites betulinus]|nr:hypothetical protein C2E23DRAFT_857638 [Lenzites betulinus]
MPTKHIASRTFPRTFDKTATNPASNDCSSPLRERFSLLDAFAQQLQAMEDNAKLRGQIAPPHASAGRRCVKRVPVPRPLPPTVFECPEEEDDYLEEAESTTACDDNGSPTSMCTGGSCDKPLPAVPRGDKALPPTPSADKNKPLPPVSKPLPLPPRLQGKGGKSDISRHRHVPSLTRSSGGITG